MNEPITKIGTKDQSAGQAIVCPVSLKNAILNERYMPGKIKLALLDVGVRKITWTKT